MDDRRFEAAKAAMQGMLANQEWGRLPDFVVAKHAVKYGDALIAALREAADQNAALDTLAAEAQEAGEYDEVGDWREYASKDDDLYIARIARGSYHFMDVENAFDWAHTPQGFDFWDRIALEQAAPAEEARARDFARRALEAMEKEER